MTSSETLHSEIAASTLRVHLSNDERTEHKPQSATLIPSYHFAVKVISRSQGRCILHCVAYRSACKMYADNGALAADYTRRRGVLFSQIILPASSPTWAETRNSLWVEAARAETRKNSIEAREFEATIPYGVQLEDAIAMCSQFATELVVTHGFAVDLSLHADNRKNWMGVNKNPDGYHCHFLATTRRLEPGGFTKKTRELDIKASGMIRHWRERWAELANSFLANSGSAQKVSHLSNYSRGIESEPTRPLGHKTVALERQGIRTRIGEINRERKGYLQANQSEKPL